MKATNVTHERADMDLRMWLNDFDAIFEIDGAVTFYLKLLLVLLADNAAATHINQLGEQFILV